MSDANNYPSSHMILVMESSMQGHLKCPQGQRSGQFHNVWLYSDSQNGWFNIWMFRGRSRLGVCAHHYSSE